MPIIFSLQDFHAIYENVLKIPCQITKNMKIFTFQPGYFFSRFASQLLASKCLKRLKMRRKFSGRNRIRGRKVQIFGIFDAIWVLKLHNTQTITFRAKNVHKTGLFLSRKTICESKFIFEPRTIICLKPFWTKNEIFRLVNCFWLFFDRKSQFTQF